MYVATFWGSSSRGLKWNPSIVPWLRVVQCVNQADINVPHVEPVGVTGHQGLINGSALWLLHCIFLILETSHQY